jgi:hypothetical protein
MKKRKTERRVRVNSITNMEIKEDSSSSWKINTK